MYRSFVAYLWKPVSSEKSGALSELTYKACSIRNINLINHLQGGVFVVCVAHVEHCVYVLRITNM